MITTRRAFLAAAAFLAAGSRSLLAYATPATSAPQAAAPTGPYTLPPLPYRPTAIEPAIDAETMTIHHDRHHRAYVDNLNRAVAGLEVPADVERLIADLSKIPADRRQAVRDNGGGHANHTLFWTILTTPGEGGEPGGALAAAIERDLGGLDSLRAALSRAGLTRFGSGWSWLVVDDAGRLVVTSTPNQDSPLMRGGIVEVEGTPILGLDVWEHAYYLKYQNRRGDYLAAIWPALDWAEIGRRYDAAIAARTNGR